MHKVEILENGNVKLTIPMSFRNCAGRKRIVTPDEEVTFTDPMVSGLARAFRWQKLIDERRVLQCPGTRPCHRQGYGVCFPDYPTHAAVAGNHPRCSHRAVEPNRRGKVQAAVPDFMG